MSPGPRVLFATSEIAPWQKTGGLGDISSALPAALASAGVEVRILVPAYPALRLAFPDARVIAEIPPPGGRLPGGRLLQAATAEGVPLLLLDCPACFDRPGGPYQTPQGQDWPDNALRFGLLSRVAALLASNASPISWRPDILHCNDWQSALAPAYLHYLHGGGAATVMTIHNLAFQGLFPASMLADLGLPPAAFAVDGVEFYGHLSFLKAGLQFADRITTVSPTYAREIQQTELGFGLDGLLRHRSALLTGILNGVDASWNPATDPLLAKNYDAQHLAAKAANRRALRAELGLIEDAAAPLLAAVSRLTHQKGVDLLLAVADRLLAGPADAQLVVLGHGERDFEAGLRALAARHPGRVAAVIGFDERLAHRIEAAADIFLMPSRFEPCGLNQLFSLRYGTPPVVRATGGLADTVADCTPESLRAGRATGFVFGPPDAEALLAASNRAIDAWHDRRLWRRLQRNGMAADFSWAKAAADYLDVYRAARERHGDMAAAPIRGYNGTTADRLAASSEELERHGLDRAE